MNISFLMILAVPATGLVFVLKQWSKNPKYQTGIYRQAAKLFPVLFLIVSVRELAYTPFQIPTGSMRPALQIGEHILVSRHAYDLKIPGTSISVQRLGTPKRGEVIVFKYPPQPSILYVKRVVGLPGDVVRYDNKRLFVNGEALTQLDTVIGQQFIETNGDRAYTAQIDQAVDDDGGEWSVPVGHYFVVGDNRDGSRDSRVWGFVPEHHLIGRAEYVWVKTNGWGRLPDFSVARAVQ